MPQSQIIQKGLYFGRDLFYFQVLYNFPLYAGVYTELVEVRKRT